MAVLERLHGPFTEETYSGGVLKRTRGVFDKTAYKIVGNGRDGEKLHSRHIFPALPPNPLDSTIPAEIEGAFNREVPEMMARFSMADFTIQQEAYIEGIGGYDLDVLPKLAIKEAEKKVTGEITGKRNVIRMVYGATENMPYRALSYALPALVYMEHLQQGGVNTPQLQIVFANNISGSLNELDREKVQREAKRVAAFTKAFAKEAFPTIADDIVFVEDTPLDEEDSVLGNEIAEIAREIQQRVPEDVQKELFRKGNGLDEQKKLFYGAAHVLLHDSYIPGSLKPLFDDEQEIADPSTIISMGGSQEKFFYNLRHMIKPYLDTKYHEVDTMQLFTRHLTPPYMMARDDRTKKFAADIPLSSVMEDPSIRFYTSGISRTAVHNIDYLETMAKKRGVDLPKLIQQSAAVA